MVEEREKNRAMITDGRIKQLRCEGHIEMDKQPETTTKRWGPPVPPSDTNFTAIKLEMR